IEVRIVTARANPKRSDASTQYIAVAQWCKTNLGFVPAITCEKDSDMAQLWDDRAVQVIKNEGISVQEAIGWELEKLNELI
ncbi:MAG: hypothetical protein ACRDF4_02115, partial [Rhabdochlamydiaceae bacterium]